MSRHWIDEGLQREVDREAQERLATERRHHHSGVIREKGPEVMRQLLAEVTAVLDEYARKAAPGRSQVDFRTLPHEGFRVERTTPPGVLLECRPDYEAQLVYCSLTRAEDDDSEVRELPFTLHMVVDEHDRIALRHEAEIFDSVDAAVEFLVKPVLFPLVEPGR
jgi:hypothetical protein